MIPFSNELPSLIFLTAIELSVTTSGVCVGSVGFNEASNILNVIFADTLEPLIEVDFTVTVKLPLASAVS